MFIGHYATALVSKRFAPKTSLGTLFLSAQLLDLLSSFFLLLGLEHVRIEPGNTVLVPIDFYDYPFSHSFVAAAGWSLTISFLYFAISRYARGSWIVGLCAFMHWILDAIVHRPDLPLTPGGNVYIGLGLWNSLTGTIIIEFSLFFIGLAVYLRTTMSRDRIGEYGLWSLLIVLIVIGIASIFDPLPPGEQAISIAGNASWFFVLWAYWIDRHRKVCSSIAR